MWFLLLLILFSSASNVMSAGCTISTNGDLGEPQPLIVNLNITIRLPQERDEISFEENEEFLLSCPSGYLIVASSSGNSTFSDNEYATCSSGKMFTVQNETTIFSNITCSRYPYHVARLTNNTCEEDNQEIETGFFINSTYLRHLRICFNNTKHVTLYSHFELPPNIQGRQSNFPRPSWINDNFYSFGGNASNYDANALVTVVNQIATISKLIGHNSTTENPYVNSSADLYLARGHLTAKADFVFGSQQRLTFYMVNAMPQWQTFNGRNWADFEADARNLAINYNLTLQAYTGTYGVMKLPHLITNESVEIYLYNDDRGNQEFPVPLLFWRFLYEPITEAGIVIVGVNNPYITNISEAIICNDIFDSINWTTTFTRNNILNGYMYGCSPDEFRKTVTYMPYFPVKSLLLFNSSYNGSSGSLGSMGIWTLCSFVVTISTFFSHRVI